MSRPWSKAFDADDPDAMAFIVDDALKTTIRAVDPQTITSDDMDATDAIMVHDAHWPYWLDEAAASVGVPVTARVVRTMIVRCLWMWSDSGREALAAWSDSPTLVPDGRTDDPLASQRTADIVRCAHRLATAVAEFTMNSDEPADASNADGDTDNVRSTVAASALALSEALALAGRPNDAVAAAFTSGNYARSPAEQVGASEAVLRGATAAGDLEAAGMALGRRVHALVASDDPARRLDTFDAMAAALRHLPSREDNRAAVQHLLEQALDAGRYLECFRPLVIAAFAEGLSPPLSDMQEQIRLLITIAWPDGAEALGNQVLTLREPIIELERARETLLPVGSEAAVFTSWTTWSFDHSAYRNAIPHGRSIEREAQHDLILLTVGHELTHVFSMFSGIGLAVMALRAAAVELELSLWTFGTRVPNSGGDLLASLDTSDVLALAQAEQALEVARKRQILQATWLPWFEGIAAFGELAADPTAEDVASDVGEVLVNLIDDTDQSSQSEAGEHSRLLSKRLDAERQYAAAQRTEGRQRLRSYLDAHRTKYLAGYLAVRRVVAAWRGRLNQALVGAEAYRILIHRTRYDTWRAVPDPALPADRFATEAERLMLAWVADLAATTGADLQAFLAGPDFVVWRDGRLARDGTTASELSDELLGKFFGAVRAALNTLATPDTVVTDRVPDADEITVSIMEQVRDALALRSPTLHLTSDLARSMFAQQSILPLGRVTCPFWLKPELRMLICVLRTATEHVDTGESSYQLLGTPLDTDVFERLEAEVTRCLEPRMTVHRVADLVSSTAVAHRNVGRQFVVFRYGDWTYVQNRGFRFGESTVPPDILEDIENRLTPPAGAAAESAQIASFVPVARRTIDWIDSVSAWTAGDFVLPLEIWARRVRRFAEEVIGETDGLSTEARVNRRLLESTFGPGHLIEGLLTNGIRSLDDDDPTRLTRICGALLESGLAPTTVPWLDDENAAGSARLLFAPGSHGWDVTTE